jgi:hypothetical protein
VTVSAGAVEVHSQRSAHRDLVARAQQRLGDAGSREVNPVRAAEVADADALAGALEDGVAANAA